MTKVFYIHNEDGTKAPYASAEEAMAQASHDAKYGFQIPVKIADEKDKIVYDAAQIRKAADAL